MAAPLLPGLGPRSRPGRDLPTRGAPRSPPLARQMLKRSCAQVKQHFYGKLKPPFNSDGPSLPPRVTSSQMLTRFLTDRAKAGLQPRFYEGL